MHTFSEKILETIKASAALLGQNLYVNICNLFPIVKGHQR